MSAEPDRGLALERTTLAWNRTGLSSVAAGAISFKVFWEGAVLGRALAGLLIGVGALSYLAGARPPASRAKLRTMSLAVTTAAVVGVFLSIVG